MKCYRCENKIKKEDLTLVTGNSYCQDCLDEVFFYCEDCNMYKSKEGDRYIIDNNNICSDCFMQSGDYFTCEDCDYSGMQDNSSYIQNHGDVCQSCYENYFYCENCSENYSMEYHLRCDDCEIDFCDSCNNDHSCSVRREAGEIDNGLKFIEGRKNRLMPFNNFVGVEIELVAPYEINFDKIKDLVNVSGDGSIQESDGNPYAYEVKTMPSSGRQLAKTLRDTTKFLSKNDCKVNQSCGLHIHIDCRKITNKPIMLSRLHKTYFAFEDCLYSMLPPSRWDNNFCEPLHIAREKAISTKDRSTFYANLQGRYYIANFTALRSHNTLEIRGHSGTINSEKIRKWIIINLAMFNSISKKNGYNDKAIRKAEKMPFGKAKMKLFVKTFKLSKSIQDYYYSRVFKFNPTLKEPRKLNGISAKFRLIRLNNEVAKLQASRGMELNRLRVKSRLEGKEISDDYCYQAKSVKKLDEKIMKLRKVRDSLSLAKERLKNYPSYSSIATRAGE